MRIRRFQRARIGCGAALAAIAVVGVPAAADDNLAAFKEELHRSLQRLEQRLEAIERRRRTAPAAAVEAGAQPRSWKLPGTNTSMQVGGYAKLDIIYDINGPGGDTFSGDGNAATLPRSGTALGNQQNDVRLQANQSRLWIRTWTPTDWGLLATRIETDFYGVGGAILRLRQAYGELGPVLAGHTESNFRFVGLAPETIELRGPAGDYRIWQPQVRYTHSFGGGTTLAVAIEDTMTSEITFATSFGLPAAVSVEHWPDLTVSLHHKWAGGYAALAGLLGRNSVDDGGGVNGSSTKWGVTGGVTMDFNAKRTAFGVFGFFGRGIGRHFDGFGADVIVAGTTSTDIRVESVRAYGGVVWLRHRWQHDLRANLVFGRHDTDVENEITKALIPAGTTDLQWSITANLIWSPVPSVDFGVEYIHLRSQLHNSANIAVNRVQVGMLYKF